MPEARTHTLDPFAWIGRHVLMIINELGGLAIFASKALINIAAWPFQFSKILAQVFYIGATSIFVIALVGLFSGMVLGLQGYYALTKFGAEAGLGAAVALSLIRELGPVFSAIMIIARAGSAMAAEIGIMRISEQIDALDTMDVDPIRFLISPKIAASLISFPLLTAIFDVIGIYGGYLTSVVLLQLSPGTYFSSVESSVVMHDINGGFIKALVFGLLASSICCYQGYFTHTRPNGFGARGVGNATTSAVVLSCASILIVDYVLTSFLL